MREGGRECEPKEGKQGMFFISLKMESSSGCVDDGGVQGVVVLRSERPTLSRCVGSLFTWGCVGTWGCVAEM